MPSPANVRTRSRMISSSPHQPPATTRLPARSTMMVKAATPPRLESRMKNSATCTAKRTVEISIG